MRLPLSFMKLLKRRFFGNSGERKGINIMIADQLTEKSTVKTKDYRKFLNEVINALARVVDAKDTYTSHHSIRVAEIAYRLAKRLGYSDVDCSLVYTAGMLHDIGKIGIPESIINKNGKLTDAEFEIIKTHTVLGYYIISGISWDERIGEAVKYHHEKYNGRGYPNGLAGHDIPEIARILCIADSFDAMSSTRSYRKALSDEYIKDEIERNLGEQFDPEIGAVFMEMIDSELELVVRSNTPKKVLVVDDEQINAEILSTIVNNDHLIEAEYCTDGFSAIKLERENRYDLILLDIYMPEMNGFETLRELRRIDEKIPVIFLTSDKSIEMIKSAEETGVQDYLTKPYTQDIVKTVVNSVLSNNMKDKMEVTL